MRLRFLATSAVLIALAGCGGGGGGKDATELLRKAFDKPITSAKLSLDGQITVKGIDALRKPIRLQATGPFSGGGSGPPHYDVDLKIGVGAGQTVDTGSLSTGDRSFVKFEDSWYELDPSQIRSGRREAAGGRCGARGIGLAARRWVRGARDEGTQTVNGVDTTHVTGRLDVRRTLLGLSAVLRRCGRALGAGKGVSRPLAARDVDRLAGLVRDPSFDIYVGKRDGLIHRLSARLDLQVPQDQRARVGGLSGGTLELSVDLTGIPPPPPAQAPEGSRPVAELSRRLGGAAALTEGLKGLRGESPGGSALPGPAHTTPSVPGNGAGATDTGPGSDAFQRYAKCLDKADPQSREALQRCSRLLKRSK